MKTKDVRTRLQEVRWYNTDTSDLIYITPILCCCSSLFHGKLLFVHIQSTLGVSHTCREQYIFLNIYIYIHTFLLVLQSNNHAGIAAFPSVTPDCLAKADRAPTPCRSRRQSESWKAVLWGWQRSFGLNMPLLVWLFRSHTVPLGKLKYRRSSEHLWHWRAKQRPTSGAQSWLPLANIHTSPF